MTIDIITIFPNMFKEVIQESIIKRALMRGLVKININNLRDFTTDKHKTVDDRPFGGGVGMVLKPEPIFKAVEYIIHRTPNNEHRKPYIILLSPQGNILSQEKAKELSTKEHLILICGRYEGVDERVKENLANEEISIGDYILTGGEVPAMVVIDAVIRLIPKVLEKEDAIKEESFSSYLLEYPQYTRPENFKEMLVPNILLSGNHKEIKLWRRYHSLKRTYIRRPDLLEKAELSDEEKKLLRQIENEIKESYGCNRNN